MANNLAQLIFNQFIEILERFAEKKFCCDFDECDFRYRVREQVNHRLIDVLYEVKDKCGRVREVYATIDFTSICLEDLVTCKWVNYLETIAREFICDICPKKIAIVKQEPRKCRDQLPRWEPFPCKTVTTVIRKKKKVHVEPECHVIVKDECECAPICERVPCVPKQEIIIQYEPDTGCRCGGNTVLVQDKHEKHGFKDHKGKPDFNHHEWKCCVDRHERKCCNNH
ncbi:hypothetical protein [Acanthamoeba polyphaga mimivirus]|uniref:Uncharacterized protein n=6 Tax=Megamimivirinae TaxID=3044648 RepID=A0A2L2DIM8_MIMIV|nr:hypothetical protein MegaChil _gp0279 [Megavirus chiliensis]AEX61372.1 hypothetical protein c7_L306 [Megavirus courdo7]AFX92316.1 hypothetical protein CE11_00286 [Megavirus courdo11]AGD92186.1 hypothetical protein LBA_00266 [Megavirus lba]AUV58222.1 hypothetical protein [Bandra megavirus]AVG46014.1 hypothetical protein [Acanthamoeba polyphaga mimivirus]AVL93619.1 hypothetical protein mvi_259 [Megavirus vitis]